MDTTQTVSPAIVRADHGVRVDSRDEEILQRRCAALDLREGPRVGDWIDFADGIKRRISHVWDLEDGSEPDYQTSSDGHGYYLGDGYVSFSGTLYRSVPRSALTLTDERRLGHVWFFHHDWMQAHSAVYACAPFRVYRASVAAPT